MVHRATIFLWLMLAVVVGSCYRAGAQSIAHTSISRKDVAPGDVHKLLQRLDEIRDSHKIPAYALIITSPNRIIVDQVRGNARANSAQVVSPEAYFRIGSITKTFIGLSALIAQKQGKLDLNDSVYHYLSPELLENNYSDQSDIRIAHLLEHTSGLPDMSKAEFDSNDRVFLKQGLARFSHQRNNKWPAGLFYSYSNTNYGLAGRVLEVATQREINQWLTESLFVPLGMDSATMHHTDKVKRLLVPGYQRNGVDPIPYWNMIYPSLGAINLQPRDMAKLIQMYLQEGNQIVAAEMISRQESPATSLAAHAGLTYGYGLGVYQWYQDGYRFFGHGGDADGYLSHFGYQKDIQLGYFVVINTFNGAAKREMKSLIERSLIDWSLADSNNKIERNIGRQSDERREREKLEVLNSKVYASKNQAANSAQAILSLDVLAGEYQPVTHRFKRKRSNRLFIKTTSDQLMIKQNDRSSWYPLFSLGNGQFRYQFEPAASIIFFKHQENIYMVGDEGNFVKL